MKKYFTYCFLLLCCTSLVFKDDTANLPIGKIRLPTGFRISVFAQDLTDARSLAVSPNGTVFVGNRRGDKVYALQDTSGNKKADKIYTVAKGLNMPTGVAFRNGDLFIAEVDRIVKIPNVEANLDNPPEPVLVNDQLPPDESQGWKKIAFGEKGKIYVSVGSPCEDCICQWWNII